MKGDDKYTFLIDERNTKLVTAEVIWMKSKEPKKKYNGMAQR